MLPLLFPMSSTAIQVYTIVVVLNETFDEQLNDPNTALYQATLSSAVDIVSGTPSPRSF